MAAESPFPEHSFDREDESPDPLFYAEPRLLVHIDDGAIAAARALYAELLPPRAAILDVMSSFRSHMPPELEWTRLAGLGLNAEEMRQNDQLTDYAVHDVNADPRLPYAGDEFDGAVMTVSVQYLARPVEVFTEVGRVLRPDAPFIVTYSNRCFPTKAVRIWLALDDRERATLIGAYFRYSGAFGEAQAADRWNRAAGYGDPLYAVWARRL